jgi:hypothetical protein
VVGGEREVVGLGGYILSYEQFIQYLLPSVILFPYLQQYEQRTDLTLDILELTLT